MKIIKYTAVLMLIISLSTIIGYYFKKPSSTMLRVVSGAEAEWRKDLLIESYRSSLGFFELKTSKIVKGSDGKQFNSGYGSFLFNWMAFFQSLISFLMIFFLVIKTRIIDLLKLKIKP